MTARRWLLVSLPGFVLGSVVGFLAGRWTAPRGSVLPPSVAMRADTVRVMTAGETREVVRYVENPALSAEITRLRAELEQAHRSLADLLSYVGNLQGQSEALLDSLSRAGLDTTPGILRLDKTPGGLRCITYHAGRVATWSARNSRERWSVISSGPQGKPQLKQNRPPLDFGATAWLDLRTPPTAWQPNTAIGAGLMAKRDHLRVMIGPEYDGALRLAGRVEWGLWF